MSDVERHTNLITEWRWFKKKIDELDLDMVELFHITDSADNYPQDEYHCMTLVCVARRKGYGET